MSSSSRALQALAIVVALGAAPLLAACSGFTPIYGDYGIGRQHVAVKYPPPGTRLDRIICEHPAGRPGKSQGPEGATISVPPSSIRRHLPSQTIVVTPRLQYQAVVPAVIPVTSADGKILFQGSRSTTADFT